LHQVVGVPIWTGMPQRLLLLSQNLQRKVQAPAASYLYETLHNTCAISGKPIFSFVRLTTVDQNSFHIRGDIRKLRERLRRGGDKLGGRGGVAERTGGRGVGAPDGEIE